LNDSRLWKLHTVDSFASGSWQLTFLSFFFRSTSIFLLPFLVLVMVSSLSTLFSSISRCNPYHKWLLTVKAKSAVRKKNKKYEKDAIGSSNPPPVNNNSLLKKWWWRQWGDLLRRPFPSIFVNFLHLYLLAASRLFFS
jgi:hypothetical protein